jgi:Zn-dependent protease with chaperone function
MGIPMSAIVTPLLAALALFVYDVVGLATPVRDVLAGVGQSSSGSPSTPLPPVAIAGIVAGLVIPGAIAMFVAWLGARGLFGRRGAGASVLVLGARDPSPLVLEERQLTNVVAEMAVAAGVPPPAVQVLDSHVANAAVVGGALDDATVVVSTGLLQALDRDETQAVVGVLIGSAGNGDLKIGVTISSLFQTLGVMSAFLNAPWDRSSRHNVRRLLGLALRPSRRTAADVAAAGDLLSSAEAGWEAEGAKKTGCLSIITLPFLMAGGAFMMNRLIFGMLLVNPLLRRRWRERRYLADATAVELTRNPTALARALKALQPASVPPGAEWAAHLFVVGSEGPAASGGSARPEPPAVTTFGAPVGARIQRLRRLGAEIDESADAQRAQARGCGKVAVVLILGPLLLVLGAILFGCALALTGLSLAIDMMFLGPGVIALHLLLRQYAR